MQVAFNVHAGEIDSPAIAHSLSDLYALLHRIDTHSEAVGAAGTVNDLVERVAKLGETAAELGLSGLQNVQARLIERLLPFARVEGLNANFVASIDEWLQLNFNYLAEPNAQEHWTPLIEFLCRPMWDDALSPGQMAIINRLFEVNALEKVESLLSTPESARPIIDAHAANVISASIDAITSSGRVPVLDLEDFAAYEGDTHGSAVTESIAADSIVLDSLVAESATLETALEIPPSVAELLALIRDELTGSEESLQSVLQIASASALGGAQPSLEDYRWHVERLANATEAVGLKGLHGFLSRVLESTCIAESGAAKEFCHYCEVLGGWPKLVTQYIDQLGGTDPCQGLVDYIGTLEFTLPFEAEAVQELFNALKFPHLESLAAEPVSRPAQALAEHVALDVPPDINPSLLESLLHELPSQTQEFSAALQRIASGSGQHEDVRVAQRIAHTLKGAANTVGIRGIAELSHHLEDIFVALQERDILPPKPLARVLVDAADCLEAMSEALLGTSPIPSQSLAVLQSILDWANRIDREGLSADAASEPVTGTVIEARNSTAVATIVSSPPAVEDDQKAQAGQAAEAVGSTPTLRVATTHIDDLLRLSGESKIVGGQLKEGLRRVETQLQSVKRQSQLFQQLVNELEQLVDIRGITMPTMRRTDSEFDALEMDQYSELHTVSRRLAEVAMDSREWSAAAQGELNSLEDLLLSQARHSNDTQSAILRMRMVPASTIVGRLQRGVRQTCRLIDKDVELIVKGAETLIDSDSLNQLVDPLMHLMRNAIDHGIESADEREATGKNRQGRLAIEFGREGTQIVIRCSDDGRGLDYGAIRQAAEMRGMIAADAPLSELQLGRLILEPGFSTRNEVTQISGRGIGLDIVHSRVLELKGTFDVHSDRGRGCRFVIRLPATLISAHALLVKHGKHTVAIASRGVRQILDPQAGKLASVANRLSLQVGDEVFEAYRLETLLGQSDERRDGERGPRPALLVEVSADRTCAVLVQSVIDTIDLVVKPLGKFVPKSVGLIGATILGDGGVAPVMDLPDLLRSGKRAESGTSIATAVSQRNNSDRHVNKARLPLVLVVDDSLSVRRAMEQLLLDAGFEVRLARDGLEAVAILEVKKPDLMLVDLEMPRMNGMELTAHVRNRAETRELPVIMITSRSTEKHRKQAEAAGINQYMTKPFAEDVLLDHLNVLLRRNV